MSPLFLTVLVLGFVLAAFLMFMLFVSIRADHQVTISGPLKTVDELDAQIQTKRGTLVDLDEDLARRREALKDIAQIGAEVDALERRMQDLLREEQQAEARRQEILDIREETAEVLTKQQQAVRDLDEKRSELSVVETELAEARQLAGSVDSLTQQQSELESQVSRLREEHSELKTLKSEEKELRERIPNLVREAASLQGRIDSRQGDLDTLSAELQKVRAEISDELKEHVRLSSKLEAALLEDRKLQADLQCKAARIAQMESRLEELRTEAAGPAGGGKVAPAQDWRDQLKTVPAALEILTTRNERAIETEDAALHRVVKHLEALGLTYPRRTVNAFHTAMKVNDTTQMAVLAGISGTGKSQLPRRYAEAMGIGFLQVPVQPRWDSPQDLMGFYNYIESRFRSTDMAQALYHMDRYKGADDGTDLSDRMLLILLDEMNLARVEYYFSDFLSRLESRPGRSDLDDAEARKDAEIELDMPVPDGGKAPRIFPGYNVLFAGTMNEDESTQSLSEKVVDRANVLRFAAPSVVKKQVKIDTAAIGVSEALSFSHWEGWHRNANDLDRSIRDRLEDNISKMMSLMRDLQRPMGHRLAGAIADYVANYPGNTSSTDINTALADQLEMRLLPKLRGVEADQIEQSSAALLDYTNALGDTELAAGISKSIEQSHTTGQFVWRGVTRE